MFLHGFASAVHSAEWVVEEGFLLSTMLTEDNCYTVHSAPLIMKVSKWYS